MIEKQGNKVIIIGAGMVGSTFAYALMISGLASEIVMMDQDLKRLAGEVMDLNHGLAFVDPAQVRAGSYDDCRDADLIVITAGTSQHEGETRLDLVKRNAEIVRSIVSQIKQVGTEAVLLIASNPVDVMTYVAQKESGFDSSRVIGSGTVLDSSRFRYLLSHHCGIDPSNIHACVIGEHGDSEVAVWSLANIAGVRFGEYCPVCGHPECTKLSKEEISREVKEAAYHIIDGKGATYYAVGLALLQIAESILRNENSVLTVSTMLNGEYGLDDVCLSLPTVVSGNGAEQKVALDLAEDELEGLKKSAQILKDARRELF